MIAKGFWRRLATAAGAVLVALALVATASAQGTFYREVAKDGRIYVFNNQRQYVDWEKSGEMGVGITLLGYGPQGETMVFDSEEAIHLYNFKHDRPGDPRPQPAPPAPPTVTWKDGATTMLFPGIASVRISNRLQFRYTHELPDDAAQLAGTANKGDSRGSFRVRRAKLKIDGFFYKPWLTFEIQLNWPAASAANPAAFLEDANLNWDLSHDKRFQIKVGQYKVPFGHQELTSSGSQQLVDRSLISNTYARGRDAGVQLWGQARNNKIEWRLGAFNGNGVSRPSNDNDAFQYNARIMWQPNGLIPLGTGNSGPLFSEADFESTDKPIFFLAAGFEHNDLFRTTTAVDLKDTVYSLDGMFKFKGFSAKSELYKRKREPEPAATGATATEFDSDGWFAQGGYLLNQKRTWEVVARYGTFDPTSLKGSDDQNEIRGGLNYYYNKHALKIQADFGQIENKATKQKNKELRVQTQWIF